MRFLVLILAAAAATPAAAYNPSRISGVVRVTKVTHPKPRKADHWTAANRAYPLGVGWAPSATFNPNYREPAPENPVIVWNPHVVDIPQETDKPAPVVDWTQQIRF